MVSTDIMIDAPHVKILHQSSPADRPRANRISIQSTEWFLPTTASSCRQDSIESSPPPAHFVKRGRGNRVKLDEKVIDCVSVNEWRRQRNRQVGAELSQEL
ncbi:hypothetical protein GUITHDRAFT_152439 [Guillardia theta CCMP2712]|uniref:Uncharacterized protein n=1 Tax=Guillardia theta (strain CCMP2712) TaxID=905079 RepID=L1JCK7_GUITC|nr:hypothetical protein GUITHDRAFT_152439 [Guillardia theta CCMP2712]EKX46263.1 hypothetical protein GUITHDRAFT_152439 [Guillardia theta CCMP2712]|eukprot:XP_005833243.1 hypothetical protein GUITHDRAFT_152439 [Guillardia theta CCMP2712]